MLRNEIHTNAVVIGHIDAGKSTLIGHLLLKLGYVENLTYQSILQDSIEKCSYNKSAYNYAWIVDTMKTERDRKITMNLSIKNFQTQNYYYTIIDTPGMIDFRIQTTKGISQADIAVLIVSAARGEFEFSIKTYGYTKELALTSFSLGISQIVVCINKLDHETWSEDRYNFIKSQLFDYLQSIGFTSENIKCIPISSLYGDNLLEPSENLPWFNGPLLLKPLIK